MIAYAPDARMLVQAEDIDGAVSLVAVAGHIEAVGPWVDAPHPQHLGGQRLGPRDPFAGDPRVLQAMAHLTRYLGPVRGMTDPADVAGVINTLQQLRATGCRCTPGQLLAGALHLGWPGHRAWALHELATGILTDPTALTPTGASPLQPST